MTNFKIDRMTFTKIITDTYSVSGSSHIGGDNADVIGTFDAASKELEFDIHEVLDDYMITLKANPLVFDNTYGRGTYALISFKDNNPIGTAICTEQAAICIKDTNYPPPYGVYALTGERDECEISWNSNAKNATTELMRTINIIDELVPQTPSNTDLSAQFQVKEIDVVRIAGSENFDVNIKVEYASISTEYNIRGAILTPDAVNLRTYAIAVHITKNEDHQAHSGVLSVTAKNIPLYKFTRRGLSIIFTDNLPGAIDWTQIKTKKVLLFVSR